jgi:hypothetical protein
MNNNSFNIKIYDQNGNDNGTSQYQLNAYLDSPFSSPQFCYTSTTYLFLVVDNAKVRGIYTNHSFIAKYKPDFSAIDSRRPRCLGIGMKFYIFWSNGSSVHFTITNEDGTVLKSLIILTELSHNEMFGIKLLDNSKFMFYYYKVF